MAYPSLEQYNEALQAPHLYLLDAQLKNAKVKTSGLGMPLALCGGFALTYSIESAGKRYALRCFHKEAPELERRYQRISQRIKQLSSPYFLPFDFISDGIRINGNVYPLVKMEWATGETLSEFLEREHCNSTALSNLRNSLKNLNQFLENEKIAHGDLQPGNIMVSQNGSSIQLIDYDGLYVDSLKGSLATELGQLNFQHPQRSAQNFDENLDRFSFIVLDVALQALMVDAGLWRKTNCDPDSIIFRRNDFLNPSSSSAFKEVLRFPALEQAAKNLAKIASAPISQVPRLSDFLQQRNIPSNVVSFVSTSQVVMGAYQGPYPVLDATDFTAFSKAIGSKVELVGKIHSIARGTTRRGDPYMFVNFSDWRGNAVKLTIWAEGLNILGNGAPDHSWVGRWISVSGLVDPAFKGKGYTHISLNITQRSQIVALSMEQANYRLNKNGGNPGGVSLKNSDVLSSMGRNPVNTPKTSPTVTPIPLSVTGSRNQNVLDQMRQSSARSVASRGSNRHLVTPPLPSSHSTNNSQSSEETSENGWIVWLWGAIIIIVLIAVGRS